MTQLYRSKYYFTPLLIRFTKRGCALMLDFAILVVFSFVFNMLTVFFPKNLHYLFSFIEFIVFISYIPYMHTKYNQTLGKKFFKLEVVDKNNFKPVIKHKFLRMIYRDIFARFISHAVFGLGYLIAIFNENGRTFHDLLAGTVVIDTKEKQV